MTRPPLRPSRATLEAVYGPQHEPLSHLALIAIAAILIASWAVAMWIG
jgi:hypothetical protein